MKKRPRTKAGKKRILRRKAERRAGNKRGLGIPPKVMAEGKEGHRAEGELLVRQTAKATTGAGLL